MASRSVSNYFLESKDQFLSKDKTTYFRKIASEFDIAHLTYFSIKAGVNSAHGSHLITTYPEPWKTHYLSKNYERIDPVIRDGLKQILPMDWSTIQLTTKPENNFFGEAREFGIAKHGISIPIRGTRGELALLSLNSALSPTDWAYYKGLYLPDLVYFAHVLHEEININWQPPSSVETQKLTKRERQVLMWAGKGKTCWETAKILGLAERTVSFYVKNAASKLNATTKTQAVAAAIIRRHISLDSCEM